MLGYAFVYRDIYKKSLIPQNLIKLAKKKKTTQSLLDPKFYGLNQVEDFFNVGLA